MRVCLTSAASVPYIDLNIHNETYHNEFTDQGEKEYAPVLHPDVSLSSRNNSDATIKCKRGPSRQLPRASSPLTHRRGEVGGKKKATAALATCSHILIGAAFISSKPHARRRRAPDISIKRRVD